jgi:uncharacterized protein YndB with AHSA1/START domain
MKQLPDKYAGAQMLIRKPVSEVFEAFIDPGITKNFWFTKGSDKLETGKTIRWDWEMYKISMNVLVEEIVPDKKIRLNWFYSDSSTIVEFEFKSMGDEFTFVTVKHFGFKGTDDDLLETIKDSTEGFTIVLAGLKAFLEYGINLNLVADKFPKELNLLP